VIRRLRPPLPPLERATFVERPNRFVAVCRSPNGRTFRAHLPNPGRMQELLLPGVTVFVAQASDEALARGRTTAHSVVAVERDSFPVFLDTHATNDVVALLLEGGAIPSLARATIVKREVPVGHSRFDFLLDHGGRELYLEVKSCTLFGDRAAMFPDAVTERGRRHLLELAAMARAGTATAVLFAVHSPRVRWFMPDYHTDPAFSHTLLEVRDDVTVLPVAIPWTDDLELAPPARRLTVPWAHVEREMDDRGSYLLLLRLDRDRDLAVAQLDRRRYRAGWYVYVGSAMQGLTARLARHLRREGKRFHWHVDWLRAAADEAVALPIRSSRRDECRLAAALHRLYPDAVAGFGSTDCHCPSHLLWSPTHPLQQTAFHRLLETFRMRVR